MSRSMLKGVHRRALGIGNNNQVVAPFGLETGGDGKPTFVFPSPDNVALFDDFLGDVVADEWIVNATDTGQSGTVVGNTTTGATGGIFRLTSSATTTTQTPAGGPQSINTPPMWKANQGRLRFGCRIKTGVLAGNTVFAGFTDTGGNEVGVFDTGGGLQTPASNYVAFVWSGEGGATQQAYRLVAGKADVDQSATTGVTPTANVYDTLEIEVSADGNVATGFINGKPVAQIPTAAVTPTTALAAGVWRVNTDAAADSVDIDWLNVSAGRDTGT